MDFPPQDPEAQDQLVRKRRKGMTASQKHQRMPGKGVKVFDLAAERLVDRERGRQDGKAEKADGPPFDPRSEEPDHRDGKQCNIQEGVAGFRGKACLSGLAINRCWGRGDAAPHQTHGAERKHDHAQGHMHRQQP